MGDISTHFSRSEVTCKCGCSQDTIDVVTVAVMEQVRDHFNAPIRVTSGNRCPAYNAKVGGAKSSQHLLGRAVDIQVEGVSPAQVFAYLDPIHTGGLGSYPTFTHLDSRSSRARW